MKEMEFQGKLMDGIKWRLPDGTDIPLPDSYEVEMNDVEADSGGETEAGTTQRDGFKAKLEKDTSYKGLWTVGFALKEM